MLIQEKVKTTQRRWNQSGPLVGTEQRVLRHYSYRPRATGQLEQSSGRERSFGSEWSPVTECRDSRFGGVRFVRRGRAPWRWMVVVAADGGRTAGFGFIFLGLGVTNAIDRGEDCRTRRIKKNKSSDGDAEEEKGEWMEDY